MSMPNLTPAPIPAYDWLAQHAWRTPEKTAVIDLYSGRRHTFAVFDERARRLASHLRDGCGVRRGERVAILAPNSTDYLEVQFACVKLGAVSLPLNWRLAVPELEFIVNDATPRRWVESLYRARLGRGESTAEAIRSASRGVLDGARAGGESAHPFFWGAFVGVGGWH